MFSENTKKQKINNGVPFMKIKNINVYNIYIMSVHTLSRVNTKYMPLDAYGGDLCGNPEREGKHFK